jgi:hypothetical protein
MKTKAPWAEMATYLLYSLSKKPFLSPPNPAMASGQALSCSGSWESVDEAASCLVSQEDALEAELISC